MSLGRKEPVHVEALIYVEGSEDKNGYGGHVSLRRIRGKKLIRLQAYGARGVIGSGPVEVDPSKLRDALDQLVNEDLGK